MSVKYSIWSGIRRRSDQSDQITLHSIPTSQRCASSGVTTPAYVYYSMLSVAGYRLFTGHRLPQDNYPPVHDS